MLDPPVANTTSTRNECRSPSDWATTTVYARWIGYEPPPPQEDDDHTRKIHLYTVTILPERPLCIGMRISVMATSPRWYCYPEASADEYDAYDAHVVGKIVGVAGWKGRKVILEVENECAVSRVRRIRIKVPYAPEATVRADERAFEGPRKEAQEGDLYTNAVVRTMHQELRCQAARIASLSEWLHPNETRTLVCEQTWAGTATRVPQVRRKAHGRNGRSRGLRGAHNKNPIQKSAPVILVPATPSDDEVPVATEDEGTPTPESSKVNTAAAPTAMSELGTLGSIHVTPTGTTGATEDVGSAQAADATTASQEFAPPSSPMLRPMPSQQVLADLDDSEIVELPPPMFEDTNIGPMNLNRDVDEDILAMSLPPSSIPDSPPSSPIHVPSSNDSPTLGQASPVPLTQNTFAFGDAATSDLDSTTDFWQHFHTPRITDSNLPSALVTPLTSANAHNLITVATPSSLMGMANTATPPPLGQKGRRGVDEENIGPGVRAPSVFRNVGGWLSAQQALTSDAQDGGTNARANKRRREMSTSPTPSRVARSGARRRLTSKTSAGPKTRRASLSTSNSRTRTSASFNPWASTSRSAHEKENPVPLIEQARSTTLATGSEASPAATPASTTTLSGAFNMSGSFPTPHALTDTPTSAHGSAPSGWRAAPWCHSRAVPMVVDQSVHDGDEEEDDMTEPAHSSLLRPSTTPGRGESMDDDVRTELSADTAVATGRRRLHEILEDEDGDDWRRAVEAQFEHGPRASAGRRRTTVAEVEDDEEEGELRYARRRSDDRTTGEWQGASASTFGRNLYDNPERDYSYMSAEDAGWQSRDWLPRYTRETTQSSYQERNGSRFAADWDARTPRTMRRDEESDRTGTRGATHMTAGAAWHQGLRPTRSSRALHSQASTATPSMNLRSRERSLEDDNLPAALRAGSSDDEDFVDDSPTPIPQQGDPYVYRMDPEHFLDGMARAWQRDVWNQMTKNVLLLHAYNPRYSFSHGANNDTAAVTKKKITLATGETKFTITAPFRTEGWEGKGPFLWAVIGLSTAGMELMLRRRVWSYKEITFFPARRSLQITDWILALEGPLTDDIDEIMRILRSTLERQSVREDIEALISANPEYADTDPKEAFRRVLATLRATLYRLNNGTVVVNVFIHSPTQSVMAWREWVAKLRKLTFGNFDQSVAFPRRPTACTGCLGVDHLDHLCPFPQMLGWNGPKPGDNTYAGPGARRRSIQGSGRGGAARTDQSRSVRAGHGYVQDGATMTGRRGSWNGHNSNYNGGTNGRAQRGGNSSTRGRGGAPWQDRRSFGRDTQGQGRSGRFQ
ncbi:hypothetical protein C8T65DRAFT_699211 [Cerioporus squamosus]|nr:hypothetical protein C8T65DRAFT_699211 [Cerioporus squamosus]